VQAAFRATDLACAGAAGLGQVDDFLDPLVRFRRERALPVQPGRPVLFLDLRELKGSAVSLDCRPDPSAGALQQVTPSLAAMGAELIKNLKLAAIEDETSASECLEEAAKEWLERRKSRQTKK
jgi:hypothetical protein